jgi:hypothetical protein
MAKSRAVLPNYGKRLWWIAWKRCRPSWLTELSAEPIGGTVQATAAYMKEEIERWHKVIKAAGVKLD